MKKKCKLTFAGGVGTVTGANFLLETVPDDNESRFRLLVDCGLTQGCDYCEEENADPFLYDPRTIDVLLITHAHADHIGRVPKLVKDGFKGLIYSTDETKKLSEVMFADALNIMKLEAERYGEETLYEREHIEEALQRWSTFDYYTQKDIGGGFEAYFKDAGHILGSAVIELTYNETKIAFSGDLGNSPSPLLRDTDMVTDATYMVMESVYGDRLHENVDRRTADFSRVISETLDRGGTLLIPAFSLERTQEMLYELNNMVERGKIPTVPVYLDSPLAIKVTEIYRQNQNNFNDSVKDQIAKGDDIFRFPKLVFTESRMESQEINNDTGPKIIIAGSGMSHAGRIMYHEKRYLPDPRSTLLFVGYQAPGSLGRRIQDGLRKVDILGEEVAVRAHIETIFGYSGHRDAHGLFEFAEATSDTIKKLFVAMGEPQSSAHFSQRVRDFLEIEAVVPQKGQTYELEF